MIDILIADDHPIFRDGLRRLLEAEPGLRVIGEAADGAETVQKTRQLKPDILLLDLAMPRMPGLEVLREMSRGASPVRIIILTAAIEKRQIVEALHLGARGVVLKESATLLLMKSIHAVMNGQYWVGHEAISDLVEYLRERIATGEPQPRKFGVTKRELQIISTVVSGCSNKEIAERFSLSEDTVKHHLTSIFNKLGVSSRLELALFAINHQLVEKP
jgi:DNA-binding NarL/FixJ family response regulator